MLIYAIIIAAVAAYLLGNLNGAVCMSAIVAHEDVRTQGSGNAGRKNFTPNSARPPPFFVVPTPGATPARPGLAAGLMLEPYGYYREGMMLGAVAVILGHDFPALLALKGGKGVMSGACVALTMDWRIGLAMAAVFALCYFTTQYVSLGSILGAAVFGIGFALIYWGSWYIVAGAVFLAGLTIFMHRENIKRLVTGQERKTNLFSKGSKQ